MGESNLRTVSGWLVACALAVGLIVSGGCSSELPESDGSGDPLFSGRAVVVDGDTLDIGATRFRLEGIDAPEASQTCQYADGRQWPCGRAASRALIDMIDGAEVTCVRHGSDKYGRILGLCAARDIDLNQTMVKTGMAWAFVKYSTRYVAEEDAARRLKTGVWQGRSQAPWDFRHNRWQVAETAAPEGCAIKGNITGNGRIYHMPWSPWYGRISVNAKLGERWFCSEQQAQAAGWRPVRGI